jgi:membrane fusion protein, multidrug efflux system
MLEKHVPSPALTHHEAAAAKAVPPVKTKERLPATLAATGLLVALGASAGALVMLVHKRSAAAQEAQVRKASVALGPLVRVVRVNVTPAVRVVSLPAEVRAAQRSQLFAKVSGYVTRVLVDKGDRVKKGDLLAEVESPDSDQQEQGAKADLDIKELQLSRLEKLLPGGGVAPQDVDAARAAVQIAKSTLERARALRSYEKIRAPFDGVVTARYADPGALLPAATSSTTSAQPVLEIATLGKLRASLQLGQEEAALVRVGDTVQLDVPGGQLEARISRFSKAIDLRTRTMLAEIDLTNPPDNLYPGAFLQVALTLRGTPRPLVPAEALITRAGALVVPTVNDGKVHLQPIRTGVDDGRTVEILSGLKGGELVALNLGSDAVEGGPVQALPEKVERK